MTTTPNQNSEIDPIDPVSPLVEAFWNDGEPFTVADTDDARLAINSFARFAALQSPTDREGDRHKAAIARATIDEWDRAIQRDADKAVLCEIGNALRNFTVDVARLSRSIVGEGE